MKQAANRTGRSRRAMLATVATALPAVAASAVVLPMPARASSALVAAKDPHAAWAREAEDLIARLEAPGLVSDDDAGALVDRQYELECLIAGTPARTLDGALEQVAFVRRRAIEGCTPDDREVDALGNALATIGRLRDGSGGVASPTTPATPTEAEVLALFRRLPPAGQDVMLTGASLLAEGRPVADVNAWTVEALSVAGGARDEATLRRLLDASRRVGGLGVRGDRA